MDIRQIIKIVIGIIPVGIGFALLVPALYAFFYGGSAAWIFMYVAAGCFGVSLFSQLFTGIRECDFDKLHHRSAFAIVTFSWLMAAVIGSLPYYFSGTFPSYVDCFFESMSGFSGTGATVLNDIEGVGKDLLLWRSMTQLLGGIGVITFFIAILPTLGINGVHIFRAEITGPQKDKVKPRVGGIARTFCTIFAVILVLVTVVLYCAGLSFYDAVNHAFTAIATGGFSTKNIGVAAFKNPLSEYVLATAMLISSINFGLFYLLLTGRAKKVFFDTELRWYLAIVTLVVLLITFFNWRTEYATLSESFRLSFFIVTSTVSSTGFTNVNYLEWGYFPQLLLFFLMLMGGMSGSTAGGIKCVRIVAAIKLIFKEFKSFLHPSAVLTVRINQMAVRPDIADMIWAFIFLYGVVAGIVSALLTINGLDFTTASTAAVSALSNIGPAFGSLGPYGNHAALPELSKVVLAFAMFIGRLEFFTALIILTPAYWRK